MRKINFSAGPSVLPDEVFQQMAVAMTDFEGSGLSIAEISHRSKEFMAVMDEAVCLVRELLEVPQGYSILFLQGGASLQFLMAAMNLMKTDGYAAYLDSGTWAAKAFKEAVGVGRAVCVASSKDSNYTFVPKGYTIPADADYFHCTSNNTIFGTQMKSFPDSPIPVACDMSSDIFSRRINVSKFGLIYAGAQKNIGPAGTTLVIVKDELLGKTGRSLPSMLDYQLQIKNGSMYNTPCTMAIYMAVLNLRLLKKRGGVAAAEKYNEEKAALLYAEIDRNPLFRGTAEKEDRSLMNVTFVLNDPEKYEAKFAELCAQANISSIKGHRSVGGYRASIYNAMTKENIQVLIDAMQKLEKL